MSFIYTVGVDPTSPPELTAAALQEFHRFYDEVHAPEVVAHNEGFTAFQRLERAVEADLPRWLTLYHVADAAAVDGYIARSARERGVAGASPYTPFPPLWTNMMTTWRVVLHEVARHGEMPSPAGPALIVGIDPPEGATGHDLDAFDAFYSDVHIVEIMRLGRYTSAVRYALQAMLPTKVEGPAVPRYWTIYSGPPSLGDPVAAADGLGRAIRLHGLSAGPESWQRRRSRWRIPYRTIRFSNADEDR